MRRYALQDVRAAEVQQIMKLISEVIPELEDLLIGEDSRITEWMDVEYKIISIGCKTMCMGREDLLQVPNKHLIVAQFGELIDIWTQAFPMVNREWRLGIIQRCQAAAKIIHFLKQQRCILS